MNRICIPYYYNTGKTLAFDWFLIDLPIKSRNYQSGIPAPSKDTEIILFWVPLVKGLAPSCRLHQLRTKLSNYTEVLDENIYQIICYFRGSTVQFNACFIVTIIIIMIVIDLDTQTDVRNAPIQCKISSIHLCSMFVQWQK